MRATAYHWGLLASVLLGLVWSGIAPFDRFTWFLEVLPVLLALPILILTWPSCRLTPLAYGLVALHAWILMVGGHYTYAEMPLFDWLQVQLDLARNHYDRVGHLAQGFVPDPFDEALQYRPLSKFFKWTHGLGFIDDFGPRFIPIED